MQDPHTITRLLRTHLLHDAGFDLVGFAPAKPLDEEGEHLREWLNRGYEGSMEWIGRNISRRIDPRESLPDARSVIVVAKNYYTDHKHPDRPDHAKISRYAWGRDYHRILPKKLKRAHRYIQSICPDASNRWYVDTGPIMEKAWAARAGVGWMGKHTNIISRTHGSWLFLGVMLTSLELEYDEPIPDYCGSCTRCIDACPTDAIVEPYQVDSNRCISYITIEENPKNPIQPELADKFDGWVFGCDICQDVCPWNKFEQQTDDPDFEPRSDTLHMTFKQLADMNDEEFRERFRGSPVMRAKPHGMRRNARDVGRARERE